jgi:hypothetical protein
MTERVASASAKPDAIVLLEAHERPEIVAEQIDSEAAAGRLAAGVGSGIRAKLALRDARDGMLAGRGWTSARRAPGVATRLLREATRWKPCYVLRYPANCSSEALSEAMARVLLDTHESADRRVQDRLPPQNENRRVTLSSPQSEGAPGQSRG